MISFEEDDPMFLENILCPLCQSDSYFPIIKNSKRVLCCMDCRCFWTRYRKIENVTDKQGRI